ncbi:MAG: NAD+ synthase [Halobacteriaceae archaeon]
MTSQDTDITKKTADLLELSNTELAERKDQIITFIQDTVANANADGGVIGLSGGIDSTTTAFLAKEALGAENVHGLIMPSDVNSDENMSDAERVANMLNIAYDVIEINPIFDAFTTTYPEAKDDRVATGNVRVRIRGVLNYFVANHENRIVLGTGNRSEALTGYFTKYGDQAVDCNPIGNLYKYQVRQLARNIGVPEEIVTKTPSAGMWAGQSDEEELGLSYDTLDGILALHIDGPISASRTAAFLDIDIDVIEHVEDLVIESQHKRQMPPSPPRDEPVGFI